MRKPDPRPQLLRFQGQPPPPAVLQAAERLRERRIANLEDARAVIRWLEAQDRRAAS